LEPRRPYSLPVGETIVETGNQIGSSAPVSIRLRRPPLNPGAIVVTFSYDPVRVREGLDDEQWRALQGDLTITWIIFDGQVSIGKSEGCAISVDSCEVDVAANLKFKAGYWISPADGTQLTLGECAFAREVPLAPKAQLALAGAHLAVREVPKDESAISGPQSSSSVSASARG
jgi:hypothetical protein